MSKFDVIENISDIPSPSAVLFLERVHANLDQMLKIAGRVDRLRPHCKTHKMPRIVKLEIERGITKHKCATIAEAEMLADAGVADILLAYNIVGPNIERVVRFRRRYPDVTLCVTADHEKPIRQLDQALTEANLRLEVMLDVDTGMHRTGVASEAESARLYRQIQESPALVPGGLHLYDGHNHQQAIEDRRQAVSAVWRAGAALRERLQAAGADVPRIVAGGTGSFPMFAEIEDRALELSPGTIVLHDRGYQKMFPDLDFQPALWLLTRVVSRPAANRLTLDLGTKAIAADPPMGRRVHFPDLPQAVQVLHNEEHLVLETPQAERYEPGDVLLGVPRHVCPTTALHKNVTIVQNGRATEAWPVVARDRILTI